MKKHILLLLLSIFISGSVWAQKDIGFLFREVPASTFQSLSQETLMSVQSLESAQVFLSNQRVVEMLEKGNEEFFLKVPYENNDLELHVWPSQILSSEFKVLNSAGEEVEVDLPTTYWGRLKGSEQSYVTLTVYQEEISMIISSPKFDHTIMKLKGSPKGIHVIYNSSEVKTDTPFVCSEPIVGDYNESEEEESHENNRIRALDNVDGCRAVLIYFEADYDMYLKHGSNYSNVLAFHTNLFNNVAYLYKMEGVNVKSQSLKVWDTSDPYANAYDSESALVAFRNYLSANNYDKFPSSAHLAHLISTRSLGGGIAYYQTGTPVYEDMFYRAVFNSCSKNTAFAFSGSMSTTITDFPDYSWNVMVVAHELGHNFGLPHSHDCAWPGGPIDGCSSDLGSSCNNPGIPSEGGTIMSYCHQSVGINLYLGFGKMPGDKLRAEVAAASCLGGSPSTDAIVSDVLLCSPGAATLTASGCSGGTYKWYDNRFSITPVSNSTSYTTPFLSNTTTYYVSCTKPSDCEGYRSEVVVSIGAANPLPIDGFACGSNVTVDLAVTGCNGGTIKWYKNATGGSVLGTGNTFNTPPISTPTHYYAECDAGSCVSDRVKVTAVVDPGPCYCIPPAQDCTDGDRFQTLKIKEGSTTVYSLNNTGCNNGYTFNNSETINLEFSKIYTLELGGMSTEWPNGVVAWIDYNNNGEFEASERILVRDAVTNPSASQSFTTPGTSGAGIVRMRVKVQFSDLPDNPCGHETPWGDTQDFLIQFGDDCDIGPAVSGSTVICTAGGSTSLTASCSVSGAAKWYNNMTGGTLLHTGSEFITPPISATTSYYVQCVYDDCTSPRTKVTVNYSPGSCNYCDPGSLNCSYSDMITKVEIKKGSSVILSNPSSCSGPGGYTFYNSSTVALGRGETYQITIENPGLWTEGVKAWIDYNGNGTFEANEEIFSYGPTYWTSQTQSFTIPNNAAPVEVRMRVKLLFNYTPEPCGQGRVYGETEDYLISFDEGCPSVVSLTSPGDDMSSGSHIIQAAMTGGEITAENKISNTAKATYEAASIQMNPGFEVKDGAVFTAKTGGCN